MRIKFRKNKQREFIKVVIENISCPSLRELLHFGISTNYSTLKNYYNESRTLPEDIFLEMCEIANLNPKEITYEKINENWGKIEGGKKSKRGKGK